MVKKMTIYFGCLFLLLFMNYGLEIYFRSIIKNDSLLNDKVVYLYDYENLKKEYDSILEYHNLTKSLDDSFIVSKVIFKDPFHFYDEIRILKGNDDGIEVGDIVVNENGYVGKVKNVFSSSSAVELLLNSNTQMSVSVEDSYGILQIVNNEVIVSHITKKEPILEGSVVYTSKYSKIPLEIPIGKVKEVKINSKEQILVVEPTVDFNSLNYVSIRKSVLP